MKCPPLLIDLMMSKVRRTGIEDISFGLRDKWVAPRYKIEFLKQEGYVLRYVIQGEKESDTGETYIGNVDGSQSEDPNGTWVIERYTRARSDFPGQLEHYMNGRSIGHNVRDKGSESADERISRFREQINALEERFGHFMQTHGEFTEIERTYNLTFNNYVAPERDSSDLGLTGISGQVKPHPFQNQGVRYLSEEGGGILGDDVGLGKTTQAISFSLYDRQMGRSKKHCIVVPKAVLANWYMESKKIIGNHNDVMFVGFEPKRGKDGGILTEPVLDENGQPKPNKFTGPLEFIGKYMTRFRAAPQAGLPRFCGGLVGCFGYDTVRYVETKLTRTNKPDDIGTPDIGLLLSEEIAVVDNLSGKLTLVVYAEPGFPGAFQKARTRLKELLTKLRTPVSLPNEQPAHSEVAVSTFGEAVKKAVLKAKDYITEGDVMQVVLSQRMSKPYAATPLALYRAEY